MIKARGLSTLEAPQPGTVSKCPPVALTTNQNGPSKNKMSPLAHPLIPLRNLAWRPIRQSERAELCDKLNQSTSFQPLIYGIKGLTIFSGIPGIKMRFPCFLDISYIEFQAARVQYLAMDRLDSGRSKSIWDNQSERDACWYNLASMGHGGTRRLYIVTRGNSKTSCTIPSAVRSKTTEYSVVGSSLQHTWASTFPAFESRVHTVQRGGRRSALKSRKVH